MAQFEINKGVGRSVEFKGLKSQYLFLFAGGLLGMFILTAALYLIGLNPYICMVTGVAGAIYTVWKTFVMNKKYGEHGSMKIAARKYHPRYLINRKRISALIRKERIK